MKMKILVAIGLLTFIACRRSAESPSPCMVDASKCADVNCRQATNLFKFVLLDEETGEDLVFSPSPLLQPDDIKVINRSGNELAITANIQGFGKAHLALETGNVQAKDTLFLEIQGQRIYTLYPRFCHISCCTPMAYELRTQKGEIKRQSEYIFPLTY
ncbi:hypothetical protein JMG10_01275 [Nostoc ellipsosporum NOK]|jgi:hypothetical protein|nr:hypothetical protein [Nostoc ellipsosporum NOK]